MSKKIKILLSVIIVLFLGVFVHLVLAANYFPLSENLLNNTESLSGSTGDLQNSDANYRVLRSFPSAYTADYQTTAADAVTTFSSTTYTDKTSLTWNVPVAGSYLIYTTAKIKRGSTTAARTAKAQMLIDGTGNSSDNFVDDDTDIDNYRSFSGLRVQPLSAGSHTVKIQYATTNATSNTCSIKNARITAMRIDNYQSAFGADSSSVWTSYYDIDTLIFTPKYSEDYLILAHGSFSNTGSTTALNYMNLMMDSTQIDETVSKNSNVVYYMPFDAYQTVHLTANTTYTFKIQEKTTAGTVSWKGVVLYAIPTSIFSDSASVEAIGETSTSVGTSTTPTDIATLNFTPSGVGGSYLITATGEQANTSTSVFSGVRLNIGGSNSDESIVDVASTSQYPSFSLQKIVSLPASAQTVKVQLFTQTSGTAVKAKDVRIQAVKLGAASAQKMEVEYSGIGSTPPNWNQIDYALNSAFSVSSVGTTIQLWNYNNSSYPTSGDGFISYTSSDAANTFQTRAQTIKTNPNYFRNTSTGAWKLKILAQSASSTWFDWSGDLLNYTLISPIAPDIPTLLSPTDTSTYESALPTFKMVANDDNYDFLQYNLKICTNAAMTTGCQTFDQSANNTGWSGQDVGTSAYASGTTATYTLQSANVLAGSTTYYWKVQAKDPGGTNTWSSTQTTPFSFSTFPKLEQFSYRWSNDDGGETHPSATWMTAENVGITGVPQNTNIRLRFSVANNGGPGSFNFRLQMASREADPPNELTNADFIGNNSNWNVSAVPPYGWVEVPGSDTFSTNNFLVMKYEAKCADNANPTVGLTAPADTAYNVFRDDGTSAPGNNCTNSNGRQITSLPSGYPIAYIQQAEAITRCSTVSLNGDAAHLITDNEWMTISRNAEVQDINWSGGSVGNGYLYAGHNDSLANKAEPASADDNNRAAFTDIGSTTENLTEASSIGISQSGSVGTQVRTLVLSNGSLIWDLAGNLEEWTKDIESTAIALTGGWIEWDNANVASGARALHGPLTYLSDRGMGRLDSGNINTFGVHGGAMNSTINTGVYFLLLGNSATGARTYINGFRCTSDALADSHSFSSNGGISSSGGDHVTIGSISDGKIIQSVNVGDTAVYNFSAYVYDNTTGNIGGAISSNIAQLYFDGSTLPTTYFDDSASRGTGWWKLTGTLPGSDQTKDYGVLIKAGKTVNIDAINLSRQPNCGNFSDVPTTPGSSAVVMTASSNFTNQMSTTNQLTDSGTRFIAGKMVESPSNQTDSVSLNNNDFTEAEYNIQTTHNASTNAGYCFRVANSGTALNTYTYSKIAQLTTSIYSNQPPSKPSLPYVNNDTAQVGQTTPVYGLVDHTPAFSAIFIDPDTSDTGSNYQIQVNSSSNFDGTSLWDSGKTSMASCNQNSRCVDIVYGGGANLTDGSTYYWRIKFWDNSNTEGAWSDTQQFSMNSPPVVSNVVFNNDENINLSESGSISIAWTATVTDPDGYENISSFTGKLYRSGVGSSCDENQNNCISTMDCWAFSCDGYSCSVICSADISYLADATDVGSTFADQYWQTSVEATDINGGVGSASSTSTNVDVNTLKAFEITSKLVYGQVFAGSDTGSSNTVTTVTNTGNSLINLEITGDYMCTDYPNCGGQSIDPKNQQYNLNAFTYGVGTTLSTSPTVVNIGLPKSTPEYTSSKKLYWGIGIPSSQGLGNYQGATTILVY
jgi:hypothetical protein